MRILIVEDNADVARQIKSALTHELYVVDIAFDGEEGLFLGETEPYDAIILDLGLPKLDGLSILQRWRSSGNEVPVLILTWVLYTWTSMPRVPIMVHPGLMPLLTLTPPSRQRYPESRCGSLRAATHREPYGLHALH